MQLGDVAALAETDDEAREWALTEPLINEVRAAHTLLIGSPMYNFSVPATLKAWIDRLTFPAAFHAPGTGASVLDGTRVVAVLSRGGAYGPGTPRNGHDFQAPYLRTYFTNLGVPEDRLHIVKAEMTIAGLVPELARFQGFAADSLEAARTAVRSLATDGFR
ncbi:FMN-dependent NADH-azoreductase [Streptomyces sp. TS71-3]|nr:FMN-dependent NADH-azoreductase [Streptomyces sp. TS71-3]